MWEIIHSAAVCGCKKAPDWTREHGFVVDLSYFQSTVYGCDRLTLCWSTRMTHERQWNPGLIASLENRAECSSTTQDASAARLAPVQPGWRKEESVTLHSAFPRAPALGACFSPQRRAAEDMEQWQNRNLEAFMLAWGNMAVGVIWRAVKEQLLSPRQGATQEKDKPIFRKLRQSGFQQTFIAAIRLFLFCSTQKDVHTLLFWLLSCLQ